MVNIHDTDFLVKPYEDEFMTYNYEEHRYILKANIASKANIDLIYIFTNELILGQFLDLLSRSLYSVFLKNKDSKYYDKQLWLLSHSKHFRNTIQQIFMDSLWYNFRGGGFMASYQTGMNITQGKQMEIGIDVVTSVITRTMLDVFGVNERVPRKAVVGIEQFKDFIDFKNRLVELNIITQEQSDEMEEYAGFRADYRYLYFKNYINGLYTIQDNYFWQEQLALKGMNEGW